MRVIAICLMFVGLVVASRPAEAHQRTWPGQRLAATMPSAAKFTERQVVLTAAQLAWVEKALGEPVRADDRKPYFYVGVDASGRSLGVVVFLDATGENDKLELGVAIDRVGVVMAVVVFENSESGSVTTKAFLGQFVGKRAADKFKVGADVKEAKGAPIAAQAIASAVRRGLLLAMAALRLGAK